MRGPDGSRFLSSSISRSKSAEGFALVISQLPGLPLRKERILILYALQCHRAFLVIVCHVVDPAAHRIAPHRTSIVGFQKFGDHRHVLHTWIEPQVVTITMEYHWHPVVDGRGNRVWVVVRMEQVFIH